MDDNSSNSLQDAIDRLADQFLNPEPSSDVPDIPDARVSPTLSRLARSMHALQTAGEIHPAEPQPSDRISFDVLLIGHLPVLAGAWVSTAVQYLADHVSDAGRCLAFLAPENERIARLDLCTPLGSDRLHDHAGDNGHAADYATLRQSVETLRPSTDRWLVQLAGPDEVHSLESTLNIGRIILLTGSDQAAIVAAYRLLKRLAMLSDDAECKMPQLALLMAGCSQSRADDAVQRLTNTVSAFLEHRIELIGTIEAIRSSRIRTLSRFEMQTGFTRWLMADLGRMEPLEVTVRPESLASRLQTDNDQDPSRGPHRSNGFHHGRHEAAAPVVARPAAILPTRSQDPQPLSSLINGLQALPVSCPYATGIEFAIDQTGLIHVLTVDGDHDDTPAVERLLVAGNWARDHIDLLSLLDNRLSANDPKIVRHLFMKHLGRRRHLLSDSHLRCHLLITDTRTSTAGPIAVPLF